MANFTIMVAVNTDIGLYTGRYKLLCIWSNMQRIYLNLNSHMNAKEGITQSIK